MDERSLIRWIKSDREPYLTTAMAKDLAEHVPSYEAIRAVVELEARARREEMKLLRDDMVELKALVRKLVGEEDGAGAKRQKKDA